ncbi:MAG TPA: dihydroorotate dehydrogenase-like protein [Bacteroidales bacterium]|nr:dihydroorotate dehydrogenase-like protein [Bacteroidales bacterium]HOX76680.1 dihydroorotate dehydrogenase-like protein [Bacteroidales bacterium]
MDLTTTYLGLKLKNPIIVGASNLVTDLNFLKKLEDAGASAIVYKSLFEEQIQLENLENYHAEEDYGARHAEMSSMLPLIEDAGPAEFLYNLTQARKAVNIPLIASLNAVYDDTWYEYARKIEQTGVDALELNFYAVPREFDIDDNSILQEQLDTLEGVKKSVKIPVSVKLSPFYTNPLYCISELDKKGADGFVLFNRLFQPDIDLDKEGLHYPYMLSNEEDNRLPLRFAGLLYSKIRGSICSNTGILNGKDVLKMILAGADAVQIVSTIYKHGPKQIGKILEEMEEWMKSKKYNSLADFKGKLAKVNIKDPYAYQRAQYVDILMKSNEIFKKYPIR